MESLTLYGFATICITKNYTRRKRRRKKKHTHNPLRFVCEINHHTHWASWWILDQNKRLLYSTIFQENFACCCVSFFFILRAMFKAYWERYNSIQHNQNQSKQSKHFNCDYKLSWAHCLATVQCRNKPVSVAFLFENPKNKKLKTETSNFFSPRYLYI